MWQESFVFEAIIYKEAEDVIVELKRAMVHL